MDIGIDIAGTGTYTATQRTALLSYAIVYLSGVRHHSLALLHGPDDVPCKAVRPERGSIGLLVGLLARHACTHRVHHAAAGW